MAFWYHVAHRSDLIQTMSTRCHGYHIVLIFFQSSSLGHMLNRPFLRFNPPDNLIRRPLEEWENIHMTKINRLGIYYI